MNTSVDDKSSYTNAEVADIMEGMSFAVTMFNKAVEDYLFPPDSDRKR